MNEAVAAAWVFCVHSARTPRGGGRRSSIGVNGKSRESFSPAFSPCKRVRPDCPLSMSFACPTRATRCNAVNLGPDFACSTAFALSLQYVFLCAEARIVSFDTDSLDGGMFVFAVRLRWLEDELDLIYASMTGFPPSSMVIP